MKWSAAIFLVQYVEMVSPSFYSNITSTLPFAVLPTTTPRQTLAQWFAANAHLPDVCRKDFCVGNKTEDLKGVIQWPGTQAGDNVTVTCPHGAVPLKDDIAYRSCAYWYDTYTGEYTAQWETPMTDNCIWESSTTRQLFNLKANLSKAYSTGSYNLAPGILEDIRKLMGNVTLLTEADFEICADVFEMTTVNMKNFKTEVMQSVGVIIVETVSQMSDVNQDVLIEAEESCDRITTALQQYMQRVEFVNGQWNLNITTTNVQVIVQLLNSNGYDDGYGRNERDVPRHGFVSTQSRDNESVSVTFPIPQAKTKMDSDQGFYSDIEENPGISYQPPTATEYRVVSIVYLNNRLFAVQNDEISSIVVFTSVQVDGQTVTELPEALQVKFSRTSRAQENRSSTKCAVHPDNEYANATVDTKIYYNASNTGGMSITCESNILGSHYLIVIQPTQVVTEIDIGPGFYFMGFQHTRALSIYSAVGFCISIVGLLITITTYLAFKKLRRGRPTLILLNLCISLCVQMLSFLVFIPLVKNQDGCRVANILRVYLILVSLMWNGVEGFNMYLSLIQVFTGYVSHFVLKCGIIAWSVPAVIVTFPLFFDVTCYDGFYSPESNCAFVCQLPANTLYFVLLLPMSIIIVCNSAVFVMVIQVLRKQSRPVSGRSSTVDQLRGAVAMLVLLGLAWVFSGFAVINYNQVGKDLQVTQIVFQCLFVTCIAFQGFYIFLFHCARNADVRHKWASILTGVHLLRDKRSRSSSKTCTTLNKTSSSSNSNTPAVTKLTKV